MSSRRQTMKNLNVERGHRVISSGQSSHGGQPDNQELSFFSGPCELRLGPPQSLPPSQTNFEVGSSSGAQNTQFIGSGSVCPVHSQLQRYLSMRDQTDPFELRLDLPGSPPRGPINTEASNDMDDLIILSPAAYQQAISSRGTRTSPIIDLESVEISQSNQRRRLNLDPQSSYANFEGTSNSMLHVEHVVLPFPSPPLQLPSPTPPSPPLQLPSPTPPSPPLQLPSPTPPSPSPPPPSPSPPPPPPSPQPPPARPSYDCPICMGPMTDEAIATKCGHLFCDECIRSAIAVQPKCPMCRRKITSRGLLKIFLPSSA